MTSKRNIENRLERIDDGKEYPMLTLCELLSAESVESIETIDDERDIVRVDGTVYNGSKLRQALDDL